VTGERSIGVDRNRLPRAQCTKNGAIARFEGALTEPEQMAWSAAAVDDRVGGLSNWWTSFLDGAPVGVAVVRWGKRAIYTVTVSVPV
jgi:hypothetical protein